MMTNKAIKAKFCFSLSIIKDILILLFLESTQDTPWRCFSNNFSYDCSLICRRKSIIDMERSRVNASGIVRFRLAIEFGIMTWGDFHRYHWVCVSQMALHRILISISFSSKKITVSTTLVFFPYKSTRKGSTTNSFLTAKNFSLYGFLGTVPRCKSVIPLAKANSYSGKFLLLKRLGYGPPPIVSVGLYRIFPSLDRCIFWCFECIILQKRR